MGLTWRDLASSVAVVAMVFAYGSFQFRSGLLLLTSAWATSCVELVLAAVALVAGLAGLLANSGHAVEILLVTTVFLWLTATLWHVFSIGSEQ